MKRILYSLLLAAAAAVSLSSCDDEQHAQPRAALAGGLDDGTISR